MAHLSDPHLPSPLGLGPLGDLLSKRTLSRLAWQRKHRRHDPAVLAGVTADVALYGPDHVVITGDLTNFSTASEFAAAGAWLHTLGSPTNVTVSPGNHDALVAEGQAEQEAALRPWFGDPDGAAFPFVRRRGDVVLVNLSSSVATPPLLAGGSLGEGQLKRLAETLEALGRAGLFRVVMLHHPVAKGVVSLRKALWDGARLRALLERHGAELVLHGHAHQAVFGTTAGPRGLIPVIAVPSASSPGGRQTPARWHAIEIEPEAGACRIIARGLDSRTGAMKEIGRYVLPTPTGSAS